MDLSVANERLAEVSITGDFFLEPPEALPELNRALEGAGRDADEKDLAALIRNALPRQTEMVGFSPEAVARATARALGRQV